VWRSLARVTLRQGLVYAAIGCIVAVHWLTFYSAIKLANASVAAVMMAFAPMFAALTEPWLVGRRFEPVEVVVGLVTVPGVALIVGGTPANMHPGVILGGVAALLVAIFGSLNKRYATGGDPLVVTAIELAAGVVLLTAFAPLLGNDPWPRPDPRDAAYLVLLAIGCTLLPFSLALVALRHLSAFSAQLALCLEPVYAIVLAILLLGEQRELTGTFYAGVVIVLGTVLVHPLVMRRALGEVALP